MFNLDKVSSVEVDNALVLQFLDDCDETEHKLLALRSFGNSAVYGVMSTLHTMGFVKERLEQPFEGDDFACEEDRKQLVDLTEKAVLLRAIYNTACFWLEGRGKFFEPMTPQGVLDLMGTEQELEIVEPAAIAKFFRTTEAKLKQLQKVGLRKQAMKGQAKGSRVRGVFLNFMDEDTDHTVGEDGLVEYMDRAGMDAFAILSRKFQGYIDGRLMDALTGNTKALSDGASMQGTLDALKKLQK